MGISARKSEAHAF